MIKIPIGIKTIYLNGIAVGELPSTGDNIKDADAIRAFLKTKGLYKETTIVQAMHRQAVSFATTAAHLHKTDLLTSPGNGLSVVPFVVNSAFSIELYLKTLAQAHKKSIRGHELLKIFDELPPSAQTAINEAISICAAKRKLQEHPDFRKYVTDLNNAFVEWRYCYELERTNEINIESIIFVMECLHEACRSSLES